MEELEREVVERLDTAEEGDPVPYRAYAFYDDRIPAPATYMEVVDRERADRGEVPVIVHNFRYYGRAMRRWNAGMIETVVLNELHELTHWAMTDEERETFDARSREHGLPDGYWLNDPLRDVIDWVGDYPDVVGDAGRLDRLRRRLDWWVRRALSAVRAESRPADGADEDAL